jgi:hypothetical protein
VIAILISLPAIAVALYTLIEIKAFQRSTHKVEFMPVGAPDVSKKVNKEFMEGFQPDMMDDFIL